MSNSNKTMHMMLITMGKDDVSPYALIEVDCYQSRVCIAFHLECGLNSQDEDQHGKNQYQATAMKMK